MLTNAILTKTIMYFKDGSPITVHEGTSILVDSSEGIALIGNDHVFVLEDEYTKELLTC